MVSKLQLAARIILGLIYALFGGMGVAVALGVMQMPQDQAMPQAAMDFMKGVMGTGYFFLLLKLTELVGGLMLLSGIAAPVALVILAPITLHILLFHVFLTPGLSNSVLPLVMVILQIVAMGAYWSKYQPLFRKV